MKIGLIREGKTPPDRRVALVPAQCVQVKTMYPEVEILVQPSPHRCLPDSAYAEVGCVVTEDLTGCDLLFGIKEVPINALIPGKTYFFFSHTIKAQKYNRRLLQTILKRDITLVDYECLTDEQGARIIAFGRYAGIVCVGAVIRGETTHYDYVCNEAARGIQDVALSTGVPCGFGVLTVENYDQALARSGEGKRDSGAHAAEAVLALQRLAAASAQATNST